MNSNELKSFLDLTAAIAHHEQALETAVKAKQELARTLYDRYGRHAVYRIEDGDQQHDLMVARTKVGTYYFAPRIRYTKESRYAKAEKKRLDRAARMQAYPTQVSIPRHDPELPTDAELEAARKLGRQNWEGATVRRAAKTMAYADPSRRDPHCSVCGLPQWSSDRGLICKNGHEGADSMFPRRVDATVAMRRANPVLVAEDAPKHRLPIVGDVDQPPAEREPRLLAIQEPSGAMLDDEPNRGSLNQLVAVEALPIRVLEGPRIDSRGVSRSGSPRTLQWLQRRDETARVRVSLFRQEPKGTTPSGP